MIKNGIIVKPVSVSDVKSVLKTSSNDIGTLCTHPRINPWARYQPVPFNMYKVTPVTDEERDAIGRQWVPYSQEEPLEYFERDILRHLDNNTLRKGLVRASSADLPPFRLSDFASPDDPDKGYDHKAQPVYDSVEEEELRGALSEDTMNGMGLSLEEGGSANYDLALQPIFPEGKRDVKVSATDHLTRIPINTPLFEMAILGYDTKKGETMSLSLLDEMVRTAKVNGKWHPVGMMYDGEEWIMRRAFYLVRWDSDMSGYRFIGFRAHAARGIYAERTDMEVNDYIDWTSEEEMPWPLNEGERAELVYSVREDEKKNFRWCDLSGEYTVVELFASYMQGDDRCIGFSLIPDYIYNINISRVAANYLTWLAHINDTEEKKKKSYVMLDFDTWYIPDEDNHLPAIIKDNSGGIVIEVSTIITHLGTGSKDLNELYDITYTFSIVDKKTYKTLLGLTRSIRIYGSGLPYNSTQGVSIDYLFFLMADGKGKLQKVSVENGYTTDQLDNETGFRIDSDGINAERHGTFRFSASGYTFANLSNAALLIQTVDNINTDPNGGQQQGRSLIPFSIHET